MCIDDFRCAEVGVEDRGYEGVMFSRKYAAELICIQRGGRASVLQNIWALRKSYFVEGDTFFFKGCRIICTCFELYVSNVRIVFNIEEYNIFLIARLMFFLAFKYLKPRKTKRLFTNKSYIYIFSCQNKCVKATYYSRNYSFK